MATLTEGKIAHSEYRDISALKLWDKNPRSIKTERFTELKTRLTRLGQTKPLRVTKDGTVIGGNMRLRAMKELGIKQVWVSVSEATTDREIFDEALTDNEEFGYYEQEQLAELAMDIGLSPLELNAYEVTLGEPITLTDLMDQFGPEEELEEDEVPEVDDSETFSKLGEVYQLGRHRLMCGDANEDIALLIGTEKIDLLLTDPPYGIGIAANPVRQKHEKKDWDATPITSEQVRNILSYAEAAIIWGGNYFDLPASKGFFVWDKKQPEDFTLAMCEMAWTNIDKPAKMYRESVTSYSKDHPTQKPVGLMAWCMKKADDCKTVLDTYGGSGSTLLACEQTNRICYMMELDPKYCDVIRKRYANHIGEGESWQEATPVIS